MTRFHVVCHDCPDCEGLFESRSDAEEAAASHKAGQGHAVELASVDVDRPADDQRARERAFQERMGVDA